KKQEKSRFSSLVNNDFCPPSVNFFFDNVWWDMANPAEVSEKSLIIIHRKFTISCVSHKGEMNGSGSVTHYIKTQSLLECFQYRFHPVYHLVHFYQRCVVTMLPIM